MKKTFVMSGLCLLFLTLASISGSAVAIPDQNPSTSNPIFININRTNTLVNRLDIMDNVANILSQEELMNINNSITSLGNVVLHEGSTLVLNFFRGAIIVFTVR
jgi:hypothetical protein